MIKDVEVDDIAQMREIGDRFKDTYQIGCGYSILYREDKATFMTMATADTGKQI